MPGPVNVNANNSPEPDVAVTRLRRRDYLQRGTPTPADMRLIVEVSDSTLWRVKNTKAKMYAAAGVPDYWVIDLNNRKLWVYRSPSPNGYAAPLEFDENDSVAPLDAPQKPLRVGDLLP
jgi:Uma2 family endonuclease